eukprot:Anaeramoba_flamelloidesa1054814_161.p1 GENE.a1054814_161~~a1054814_161.p1  ORF type:complete len:544 (+),score=129.06 a1054814_161:141-1634(+)
MNLLENILEIGKSAIKINFWIKGCKVAQEIVELIKEGKQKKKIQYKDSYDNSKEFSKKVITGNLLETLEILNGLFILYGKRFETTPRKYLNLLKEEDLIISLSQKISEYYLSVNQIKPASNAAFIELEHLYYRRVKEEEFENKYQVIQQLSNKIINQETNQLKSRSLLYLITFLAINDKFYKARDLFLMSKIHETIHKHDIDSQIIFNRTVLQLGMSAFRIGDYWPAYSCISEIYDGSYTRELIAQGLTTQRYKYNQLEKEKESNEQRTYPLHLHINLDLIESCHLVSGMLVEIPIKKIASFQDIDTKKISKFMRILENKDRSINSKLEDNLRAKILKAVTKFRKGNWKKCIQIIDSLYVWKFFPKSENVMKILHKQIKQDSLKIYLLTYFNYFNNIEIQNLVQLFEMDIKQVKNIVSNMILNDKIQAHLNSKKGLIIFDGETNKITKVRYLVLQYGNRVNSYLDSNERLLSTKMRAHSFRFDYNNKKKYFGRYKRF